MLLSRDSIELSYKVKQSGNSTGHKSRPIRSIFSYRPNGRWQMSLTKLQLTMILIRKKQSFLPFFSYLFRFISGFSARSKLMSYGLIAGIFFLAACPGSSSSPTSDSGVNCEASKTSGVYLLHFGPIIQDASVGGKAQVSAILVNNSSVEGEGSAAVGSPISFRVLNAPSGEVTLSQAQVLTDVEGVATVDIDISASASAQVYLVEASAPGTCPLTFSLDITKPLRQLRALTQSPYDTFTNSRIPLMVIATTDSAVPLVNETITFELVSGQSAETLLSNQDGKSPAQTYSIQTDQAGQALAMLSTGKAAIFELKVKASMQGTADVYLKIRIHEGGAACTDSTQCPLGYNCNTSLGVCEPPPAVPPETGCKDDTDCQPPTICDRDNGRCLEGTGNLCDPIEGTGCPPGEICIGNQCALLPTSCKDNSECPPTWVCESGECVPGGSAGECKKPDDCPVDQTCINGNCISKDACTIANVKEDRLAGSWQFDSTLNLRDGLSTFTAAILTVSGLMRDLIEGTFEIKGVPSIITKYVSKYLKKLIDKHIPDWAQKMFVALGDVNDVISTMRVKSTVLMSATGNYGYVCSEKWDLIEFEYKGQQLSTAPSAVPTVGQVKIPNYVATEVCGVLFIGKHQVKNVVGGLIKWAVETVLHIASCSDSNSPCYSTVGQGLEQVVDCASLGIQIDQLIKSIWSDAPDAASIVQSECQKHKSELIKKFEEALAGLTTSLSFFEISGTANIPNPGQESQLKDGIWNGSLGYELFKSNFKGSFTAVR